VTWLQTAWWFARDVLLTGTGLWIIERQVFAHQPSDVLLVVGLALTTPSVRSHAKAVLSGPSAPPSSGSSDADGEPPSPP